MEAPFSQGYRGFWRIVALSLLTAFFCCACSTSSTSNVSNIKSATPRPQSSSCTAIPSHPASTGAAIGPLATIPLPGRPFQSIATSDNQWIFVSISSMNSASNGVAVLRQQDTQICLLRVIPLIQVPFGMAFTHDDRLLLVADYSNVAVIDVAWAETGAPDALLGLVQEKANSIAIGVTLSIDERYAFVANEYDGTLGVINLQRVRAHDFSSTALVAMIPVNTGPLGVDSGLVDLAISPDNRYIYTTGRIDTGDPFPQGNVCAGYPPGTLYVVDLARAEQGSTNAVLSHAFAGCGPVRVILSASGDMAWVAAQSGNKIVVFNTGLLLTNPKSALLANFSVGQAPTGIRFVKNGSVLVIANSNRFVAPQKPSTLTLLDVKQALAGNVHILSTINVGAFPRELTLEMGGKVLLLTNYSSSTLEMINVADLPGPS